MKESTNQTLTKREEDLINERIYIGVVKVKFPCHGSDVDKWIECFEEAKLKAPEGTSFVIFYTDGGAPLMFQAYRYPTQEEIDRRRNRMIKAKQAGARAAIKRANQRTSDLGLMLELASRNAECFSGAFLLTNGIEPK